MGQVDNGGQSAHSGSFLNLTRRLRVIELGTFLFVALTFFGFNEAVKSARVKASMADSIIFSANAKHELMMSCNQFYGNDGNLDGGVYALKAEIFPEHDSTVLAGFMLRNYNIAAQQYRLDYLLLPQHSPPMGGVFNYAQKTFNDVNWKEGYYEVLFSYSCPNRFLKGMTTYYSVHNFWLTGEKATLLNHLKGKHWKRKIAIPMI
jgi:hypothetical protein